MKGAATQVLQLVRQFGIELGAFSRWWTNEIRETAHEVAERLVPQNAQRFSVRMVQGGGVITKLDSDGTVQHRFSLGEDGRIPPLQEFWTGAIPENARAHIVLAESSVLICDLRLPPARAKDLSGIVSLQLERESPLPVDRIYFDWKTHSQSVDRSRIVSVAISRSVIVDGLCSAVASWGWSVIGVGVGGSDRLRFNLMPARTRVFDFTVGRRERLMSADAAALCALWCATVLAQWWFERTSLEEPLLQAKTQSAQVLARQAELDKLGKPVAALSALMRTKSATDALATMSSTIPADTWIYQAEINAGAAGGLPQISIEAYTPAAAGLVDSLQASEQFDRLKLVEAASTGVGTGIERVELVAQLKAAVPE